MDHTHEETPAGGIDWYGAATGTCGLLGIGVATIATAPLSAPIGAVIIVGAGAVSFVGANLVGGSVRWLLNLKKSDPGYGQETLVVERRPEQIVPPMFDDIARSPDTGLERAREAYVDACTFDMQRALRFEIANATIIAPLTREESLELAARLAELAARELPGDPPRKRPEPKVI